MKTCMMLATVMLAAATSAAEAQCPGGAQGSAAQVTQDACRKATDLLGFLTPQLATALASGNPTLGQGGVLGGLGHFSIDIRASAVNGSTPKLDNVNLSATGAVASTFVSKNQYIPGASLDAGIGLWRGLSLGTTHILGLDGIVTATYLPNLSSAGNSGSNSTTFGVDGSNWKFGYGARVGLLEEGLAWPGVSVAWVKRDLPSISGTGTFQASGTSPAGSFALNDFSIKTTVWRLTAAKNFSIINLSAGYGQDKYEANSTIVGTVNAPAPVGTQTASTTAPFSMTRSNLFVGVALNLVIMKLEGEYGQVSGGTVPTLLNSFGTDPNKSRTYFTVGLRFGR